MDNKILNTINQMVTLQGGVAEWTDDGSLEVLLPQKIASALKVGELVTFTTSADLNGTSSYFVTYNSDILERFEGLLENSGYVASYGIKYDGYLKQSGFEKLVTETLCPQNGLIRVQNAVPAITPYVLFNVNYTAEASEKRLGMVSFWLNGVTGVTGVNLGDALLWTVDRIESSIEDGTAINYEELLQIGSQHSEQLIERELIPWRQKNTRQLQRDSKRITEYYQDIIGEIQAKIQKRKLEGEELEREKNRINATLLELKRKIKDLYERSSIEVTAQLHSALIVWLQTVHINCQLIRKKQKRDVVAVWNPYHKQVEPLRCFKSNNPVKSFYLSDESALIICPTIWSS